MHEDCFGVAGFFEDLPVMLFVLAGAATLVFSSASLSERAAAVRLNSELETLADKLLDRIVLEASGLGGSPLLPLVTSFVPLNVSQEALEEIGVKHFYAATMLKHPGHEWLSIQSDCPDALPATVGSASRLLNALDDSGRTVILELMVRVW